MLVYCQLLQTLVIVTLYQEDPSIFKHKSSREVKRKNCQEIFSVMNVPVSCLEVTKGLLRKLSNLESTPT